jgi:hypothetical protein
VTVEPIAPDHPRTGVQRLTDRLPQPPDVGLRLRAQTVPLLWIALLWVAGAAAAGLPGALGWTVTGWSGAVLAAGGFRARRQTVAGSPARRRRRRYLLLLIAAGDLWLAMAAAWGPGGWNAVVLVGGGFAAAAPTWRRHHIPTVPPAVEPAPAPDPEPETDAPAWEDLIPAVWAETIAAQGRALPNSRLTEQAAARTGTTWTIRLDPGKQSTQSAIDASPLIASGLGLPLDQVSVDKDVRGADRATLLITDADRNPLRQVHPYPGVRHAYDPTTGRVRIGVYPDLAHTTVGVYKPGFGALGGTAVGASGAGKSRVLELFGISLQYNDVLVWVGDPQGGSSLPGLLSCCDWPATDPDEIELQLEAATDLVSIRTKINGLYPRSTHPLESGPLVILIIDECHKVLTQGSRAAKLAEGLAREERKGGLGLWLATQYPGVESYGGLPALRANLAAFNTIALRTGSNSGGMLPSLQVDPSTLPPVPGIGYIGGDDSRIAPFRGHYEPDDVVAALAAAAPRDTQLEPAVLAMLGDGYRDRHTRRDAAKAALADEIAAFDPELIRTLAAADPSLAAALDQARQRPTITISAPRPTPTPTVRPAAAPLGLLDIPPAPDFGPAPTPTPVAPAAEHPVLRTPSHQAIYQLIRDGVTRKGAIQEAAGLSETQTRTILNRLRDEGLINNDLHGTWTPTSERTAS